MEPFLDSFKGLKLWQVGVLAAVLATTAGTTYGVYALVTSSGGTGLGDDQQLVPVQFGNLVNSVSLSGSVVFPNREGLSFGTQGTVGEMLVEMGDSVAEGQALVSLDAAAMASLEMAAAQSALESALARLGDATLEAPFDGVVTAVNVGAGDAVIANTVAVEVLDPTIAEVDGIVDEIDVLFLNLGASAVVTMDALPGQALQGTVFAISSDAQNQQGVVSYPARVRLTLPEGVQLREGLSAVASVMLTQEEGILVPSQAIRGSFQQPAVQVFENGRIEDRPISLGNSDDFWTIVNEGLEPGEQVVMDTPEGSTQLTGLGGFRPIQGLQGTFGAPGGAIQVVPVPGGGGGRQFFQQQQGGGR